MIRKILIFAMLVSYPLVFAFSQERDNPKPPAASQVSGSQRKLPPDIQFEQRVYDFGVAGQQERITHHYKLKNVGKGDLTITSVRAPCDCIATLLSSKTISPGATGVIRVAFETRKYKGKQTKSIFVQSNDPDEPKIELKISGVVKTEFTLEPEFLHFGDVERGKTVAKTINLVQIGKEHLRLNRIEVNEKYFSTRLSSFKDKPHKRFKVDIRLKPNAPVGRINEVITLHTNLKRHPRIEIPICGNMLGRIRVKPQMLSLGSIKKGASSAKKIELRATDQRDFKIVKVKSSLPFLSTKASVVGKNKGFEVTINVAKKAPAGRLRGEIAIYTDDPDQMVIKVPVYGLIRN